MSVLTEAVAEGDVLLHIDTAFPQGSFPGYVKIDEELLKVGGVQNLDATILSLSEPATATHDDGATVTYAGNPFDSEFLGATTSGGGGLQRQTTVTLTNAQIKALPTTPVEILTDPGAGFVHVPTLAIARLNWTADYTNINAAAVIKFVPELGFTEWLADLREDNDGGVTSLLAPGGVGAGDAVNATFMGFAAVGTANTEGLGGLYDSDWYGALSIKMTNGAAGNLTGGHANNSVRVTVLHLLLDLSTGEFVP